MPYYCPNCLKEHTSADFPIPCEDCEDTRRTADVDTNSDKCSIWDSDAVTSFSNNPSEYMKQARERASVVIDSDMRHRNQT